jgi:MFS family permease
VVQHLGTPQRTSWSAVTALGIAVFMAAVDMTIVAIALPAIGTALRATPGKAQWVILAYNLPMIALMLPAGRWVDGVDRRLAFFIAVGGFAASSALAALAPSLTLLLAARVLQGVFAALLTALVLPVAAAVVRMSERGRAMGVIATLGPLGSVAGPGLGGLLVSGLGWRWVFMVNIPVCAVAVTAARRSIPTGGHLAGVPRVFLAEAGVAAVAALSLLLALDRAADQSWVDPVTVGLLLTCLVSILAWVRLPNTQPAVDALRRPALAGQLSALFLGAIAVGATYFLISFLVQGPLGESAATAGVVLLVLPLSLAVISPFGGAISDRIGTRITTSAGASLLLIGGLLMLPLDQDWTTTHVTIRLALMGAGAGLFAGPNQAAVMAATPLRTMGMVSGLSGIGRTLGFALAPALATVLWTGEMTTSAMRPAFTLLALMPALALLVVIITPQPSAQ